MIRLSSRLRAFCLFVALLSAELLLSAPTTNGQDFIPSYIQASDATSGDRFGWSVAVQDSTAIIGAPAADGARGAAYVLKRLPNSTWIEVQKLSAADAADGARFGQSLSLTDTLAVIGAPYAGADGTRTGAIYLFVLNEQGLWEERTRLTREDLADSAALGWSVAVSPAQHGPGVGEFGPVVVAGAPHAAASNGHRSGGVLVFEREDGESWSTTSIESPWAGEADRFGWSVAVSSILAVVGAPGAQRTGDLSGRAQGLVRDATG